MDEDWRIMAATDPTTRRRRTKDKDTETKPQGPEVHGETQEEDETVRHYFLRLDYWPL